MSAELNVLNKLCVGDVVGTTNRTVVACTQITERIPGDSFATWVAICHKEGQYHPYVVWTVVARPEGFHAEGGDYCLTINEATIAYTKRGGK